MATALERKKLYREKHPDRIRSYNRSAANKAAQRRYAASAGGGIVRRRSHAQRRGFIWALSVLPPLPPKCPILGVLLDNSDRDHTPSLDRIDNSEGYVRGNVRWVSQRWNRLKGDHTLETALLLLQDLAPGEP